VCIVHICKVHRVTELVFVCVCVCRYKVLGSTDSTNIGNIGTVQWHLALCLLLGWMLVFVCIIKGVKSSGKVSHCKHCPAVAARNKELYSKQRL